MTSPDGADTERAADGDAVQPDAESAFDLGGLFSHDDDVVQDLAVPPADSVTALFATTPQPSVPIPASADDALHLAPAPERRPDTAEGHLFDQAEPEAHPYTHSFPAPIPARPIPHHAAPRFGLGRSGLIAMTIGIVVTAAGCAWALATPQAPAPVAVASTPTPTVDPARVAKVHDSAAALVAAVADAQKSAVAFAAPLAALQGSSDEPARLAAESARQTYVAALAAVKAPSALKNETNATLDQAERQIATGQSSLAAATAGFKGAIRTFWQSIPAYAATAVQDNADAEESFRTAVTTAAAAVAGADPFGPTPFAAMESWRTALAALVADQARAVAESESNSSGYTDGDTGTGTGSQPSTPSTPPEQPAPTDPTPTTEPSTPPTDTPAPTDPSTPTG